MRSGHQRSGKIVVNLTLQKHCRDSGGVEWEDTVKQQIGGVGVICIDETVYGKLFRQNCFGKTVSVKLFQ